MSGEICILCGKDLHSRPTNLEHYVPATSIRNFSRVGIPDKLDWALRVDLDNKGATAVLATRKANKRWAVVRVHRQCNSDASPMCQDMKFIIDNIDSYPESKEKRIREYYAHLWKVKFEDVGILIDTAERVKKRYERTEATPLYSTGGLLLGRLNIINLAESAAEKPVYEHFIAIGTKRGLEEMLNGNSAWKSAYEDIAAVFRKNLSLESQAEKTNV